MSLPKPLFVTPMYDGTCHAAYMLAMKGVFEQLARWDIPSGLYCPKGVLVTKARNDAVAKALEGDYTHLFFIDADEGGFTADDVVTMLRAPLPITVGAVAKKTESGVAFSFNTLPDNEIRAMGDKLFLRVESAGTGFMCIPRSTLLALCEDAPEYNDEGRRWDLFRCGGTSSGYLSEDYYFCRSAANKGLGTWLYRECSPIEHVGRKSWREDVKSLIRKG